MDGNELKRLEAVRKFLNIDFKNTSEFQEIVELAAELCEKPVALIALLDDERNWLKVRRGVDIEIMPRDTSFCRYCIREDKLLVVEDATHDERFVKNPMVVSEPNVRFYAGAPLSLNNGLRLGTLCLFDVKPNSINSVQQKTLIVLSRQVVYMMELELNRIELAKHIQEIEAKSESLRKIAHMQSHDIRQPLSSIMGLVYLAKRGDLEIDSEWINMLSDAAGTLDSRIHDIVNETVADRDIMEARFNKMVEEIEDYAILLLDANGNVENWNKGAEKIKGYRAFEIIGKNFSVFYTDEDRSKRVPNNLIKKAAELGVAKTEGWRVRKDGSRFWGSITITAVHDDEGNVIGFTKVTRDLTSVRNAA